jgi:hypothetical protein
MVSLGVMMVGTMAVIALQQQSVRSTVHARQMTTAMLVAQRWMERLKEDSHSWTTIGIDAPAVAAALQDTLFLKTHLTGMGTQPGEYRPLLDAAGTWTVSNAFDQDGRDMPVTGSLGNSIHTFCASYRPAWIWYGHLMRVDVRVWWARDVDRPASEGVTAGRPNIGADFPVLSGVACSGDDAKLRPSGLQYKWYHVVYLPGAIRANEVRR